MDGWMALTMATIITEHHNNSQLVKQSAATPLGLKQHNCIPNSNKMNKTHSYSVGNTVYDGGQLLSISEWPVKSW